MEHENTDKRQGIVTVAARDFQQRVNAAAADSTKTTSVYSRLALIHQVAKAFAQEQATRDGFANALVDVEELTDPPLSDGEGTDEPVLIRFSYVY